MAYITNNHEVWAICPECGTEYDRRVWGSECPNCAPRLIKNSIEEGLRHGTNRNHK